MKLNVLTVVKYYHTKNYKEWKNIKSEIMKNELKEIKKQVESTIAINIDSYSNQILEETYNVTLRFIILKLKKDKIKLTEDFLKVSKMDYTIRYNFINRHEDLIRLDSRIIELENQIKEFEGMLNDI